MQSLVVVVRDGMRSYTGSVMTLRNGVIQAISTKQKVKSRSFYVTDLIKRKEVMIEHCSTDSMTADYMTKPLTGTKFNRFRKVIMKMN